MKIIEDYIAEAEKILLPESCHFDSQRINFIKNLNSIDLLAVPGSGKTTALQAKLFCISKQLPISDGAGILVLSHTNAAVNEIKRHLEYHCPRLFQYPNMISTVQEFIDKFLAIPIYEQVYGRNVTIISDEEYESEVGNYLTHPYKGPIGYFMHKTPGKAYDARFVYCDKDSKILVDKVSGRQYEFKAPETWKRQGIAENNCQKIYSFLIGMKENIIKKGILHYDDCYSLADLYIKIYPNILDIIRKRFSYVFVDETQDLQQYQLDIIDKIFNVNSVCLQRIGDPNQSIYSMVRKDCMWEPRNPMYITKSYRLSSEIADIVNYFTLDKGEKDIYGNYRFSITSDVQRNIKPHLLLYDEQSRGGLRTAFLALIDQYNLRSTREGKKYGFYIIGWNVKAKNEGLLKAHLEDLFPEYNHHKTKLSYQPLTLAGYIELCKTTQSTKEQYLILLKAISAALRSMEIYDEDGRYFTPTTFVRYLKKDEQLYNLHRLTLYDVIHNLYTRKSAYTILENYIKSYLSEYCNIDVSKIETSFFDNGILSSINMNEDTTSFVEDDDICIGSVHSVKGMTHCATMYVETYYQKKFESQHLSKQSHNPFLKEEQEFTAVYPVEAMKMLYVGFSRPTHLLCYATQKSLWSDDAIKKMHDLGWEIKEL